MLILTNVLAVALTSVVAHAEGEFNVPVETLLEGKRIGSDVFEAAGIERECKELTFAGTAYPRALAIEPRHNDCRARALTGLPAKFVWSGCTYRLHGAIGINEGTAWRAGVDLVCPTTYSMEWHVYEDMGKYREAAPICTVIMPPQAEVGTAELRNVRDHPNEIEIHWSISRVEYHVYGSVLFCGTPVDGVKPSASYYGKARISASGPSGRPFALAIGSRVP